MFHQLLLLRHAQTHSTQYYNTDKARALKPEGITQATQLGKFLIASDYHVDLIISSDAERARTTATLIAAEIKYPPHHIQLHEKIYSGSMNELLTLILKTPDSVKQILMVGHYPTIVELNNYLSDSQKGSMDPCELTVLQFDAGWSAVIEGSGTCALTYHPSWSI